MSMVCRQDVVQLLTKWIFMIALIPPRPISAAIVYPAFSWLKLFFTLSKVKINVFVKSPKRCDAKLDLTADDQIKLLFIKDYQWPLVSMIQMSKKNTFGW